jgi:hypothetical protein
MHFFNVAIKLLKEDFYFDLYFHYVNAARSESLWTWNFLFMGWMYRKIKLTFVIFYNIFQLNCEWTNLVVGGHVRILSCVKFRWVPNRQGKCNYGSNRKNTYNIYKLLISGKTCGFRCRLISNSTCIWIIDYFSVFKWNIARSF